MALWNCTTIGLITAVFSIPSEFFCRMAYVERPQTNDIVQPLDRHLRQTLA